MAINEEIVDKFKDELRRILMTEAQSLKERIAAIRVEFVDVISRLENEVEANSTSLADRMEEHLFHTIDPLLILPEQAAEQRAVLSDEIASLKVALEKREAENAQFGEQISQLERELAALRQELSTRNDSITQWTQERARLEERVAEAVEEIAKVKAEASRTTREVLLRLLSAAERMENKKSQVDILTAFLEEAAQFSSRVALFVAKGDTFSGWRSQGFNAEVFSDSLIKSVHFSMHSPNVLREALWERCPVEGSRHSHPENDTLLDRLGAPLKDACAAIPLVVRGKSTAVLYADGGTEPGGAFELEALELLVQKVALSVELLAYRAKAEASQRPLGETSAAPRADVPVSLRPTVEPAGESPAGLPRQSEFQRGPSYSGNRPSPLSSITEPARPTRSEYPPLQEVPAAISGNELEVKLHHDAKRFARLLVSEIKLYNEQKVILGRKNRDLYDRLKEDIDRSREMYIKRVSPSVAQQVDYFYQELVRTLGENDPEALGSSCPGPISRTAGK